MFNSVWITVKGFGITFVNPFTTSFRPPGPQLSHKNVYSFILRSSERRPNQFDLLRQISCLAFLN